MPYTIAARRAALASRSVSQTIRPPRAGFATYRPGEGHYKETFSTEPKTIVSSHDEFSPLEHVIIGRADGCCIPPKEPANESKVPFDSPMRGLAGKRHQDTVDAANKQLDFLAKVLEDEGVTVDRPTPIDHEQNVHTPDFSSGTQFGCMPARDVLLTVGNEMLEATMSYRSRWFEYLNYRPLVEQYWRKDPNMRWESAPKPRLTDESFRIGWIDETITHEERLDLVANKVFVTQDWTEPLFDAADVLRLGKDLFVQHGCTTNAAGCEWIKRHFEPQGYRVHKVNFPGDAFPIHIDATFTPLRPGLLINNPGRPLPKEQRGVFERNGWDIIEAAVPSHDEPPPLCYSSTWLCMNVLVLNPETVIVEASEKNTIEQIKSFGMNVIDIPFRDAYAFGGGLHCSSADVRRAGVCEDYFPNQ
jgi:glycine amidinotransferase